MKPQLYLADQPIRFDHHIDAFLHSKALRSSKTISFYELGLRMYRSYAGPIWPPTDESIVGFLASCKARGLADATVHAYFRAVRAWLNWLERKGKLERNPLELMESPPRPRRLPRAPQAVHIAMLLVSLSRAAGSRAAGGGHWRDVRDCAAIGLIYETGVRVSEAAGLVLTDLHMQAGTAVVRRTKSRRDRVVCFGQHTGLELRHWLEKRPIVSTSRVFLSKHRSYNGGWGPLTADGIRYALERCCKRANVPRMSPHDLRHAHALHFLRAGGDVIDLQAQLGHANLETTQIYAQAIQAGRSTRHELHSPRKNLGEIVANETSFAPTDS